MRMLGIFGLFIFGIMGCILALVSLPKGIWMPPAAVLAFAALFGGIAWWDYHSEQKELARWRAGYYEKQGKRP